MYHFQHRLHVYSKYRFTRNVALLEMLLYSKYCFTRKIVFIILLEESLELSLFVFHHSKHVFHFSSTWPLFDLYVLRLLLKESQLLKPYIDSPSRFPKIVYVCSCLLWMIFAGDNWLIRRRCLKLFVKYFQKKRAQNLFLWQWKGQVFSENVCI